MSQIDFDAGPDDGDGNPDGGGPDGVERRVFVLGASGGIGRACAHAFLEEGAQVWGTYNHHPERLGVLEEHPAFCALELNMHSEADAKALARAEFLAGGLDVLVLAPGSIRRGPVDALEVVDLSELWRDNVEGPWRVWAALRSALRQRSGSAVGFSCVDLDGLKAKRSIAAYAAVKSAWTVLLKSAAAEEAAHGVRLNLLAPGWIGHPDAEASTRNFPPERIPLGRLGDPQDIAAAALWLCSDEASYVTGTCLEVAGGFGI